MINLVNFGHTTVSSNFGGFCLKNDTYNLGFGRWGVFIILQMGRRTASVHQKPVTPAPLSQRLPPRCSQRNGFDGV